MAQELTQNKIKRQDQISVYVVIESVYMPLRVDSPNLISDN